MRIRIDKIQNSGNIIAVTVTVLSSRVDSLLGVHYFNIHRKFRLSLEKTIKARLRFLEDAAWNTEQEKIAHNKLIGKTLEF